MMNASAYVRLSDTATAANLSLDGMMRDLEAVAAREGLTIVGRHVDDGISGAVRDRPGFVAWLEDARTGRADTLLCWHADRLTREGVNVAALILDVVEGKDPKTGAVSRPGVRLLDAQGLDSRDGDAFRWKFVIAAEVARAERERMRARSLAAQRRLREAGRHRGGAAPYGARVVALEEGGKILEVEPVEADALREVARRLFAGASLGEVTRWAVEHAPPPRRGGLWQRTSLRYTLTSETTGRLIFAPAERRALRQLLEAKESFAKGGRRPTRLLSRLLVCAGCGSTLQVGRSGSLTTYVCPTGGRGRPCPARPTVSALPIEAYVSEAFLASPAAAFAVLDSVAEVRGSDRLAVVEDRLAEVWDAMPSADKPTRTALLAEADLLESERDSLAAEPVRVVRFSTPTGRTLGDLWADAASPAERQAVLRDALAAPIVLGPGRRGGRGFDPARLAEPLVFAGDDAEVDVSPLK